MKPSDDKGIQVPHQISFELDELYIDDGAQVNKVHEFEPEKFIAFSWWINKIYIFKRSPNFMMGGVDKELIQVIEPSFGMNFQCVGLFKIPKTKTLFILKLREGMVLLDADTQQVHKLNVKKTNSTMAAFLLQVIPGYNKIMPAHAADYSRNTRKVTKNRSLQQTPEKNRISKN